jgi:hypothetical protein
MTGELCNCNEIEFPFAVCQLFSHFTGRNINLLLFFVATVGQLPYATSVGVLVVMLSTA